jgi:hypothetical protein
VAQCGELLEQAKAVLLTGLTRSSAEMALLSAGLQGSGPFVAVGSDPRVVGELASRPEVKRTTFISTAGDAFEALLCEQKLSGLLALRRIG